MNNPWSLEWLHVNEINHGEHKKKNDTICANMSLMLIALCLKYKQKLIICSRIAPSEKNFNILNTEKWLMLGEMMWQESWSNYCPWYVCSESSHYIPWIYKVSVYLKFFYKKSRKKHFQNNKSLSKWKLIQRGRLLSDSEAGKRLGGNSVSTKLAEANLYM